MSTVVVGVDESEGARDALRWAVREAAMRDAALVAVLAWGFLDQHADALDGFNPDYGDADADAALEQIIRRATDVADPGAIRRRVVCDLPAPALLDAARDSDLLVVGARGLGGFRGLLLGSVSQQCVHHATVPTVVVRHPADRRDTAGVVVGIDGSLGAERALAWAAEEARVRSTRLTVVHGYQLPLVGAYPYATMTLDPTLMSRAAEHLVDTALDGLDVAGLDVIRVASPGGAAHAVLAQADAAELVVVGSRGLGRLQRILLGSVATQVVLHAPCPVAVIPSPPSADAARDRNR